MLDKLLSILDYLLKGLSYLVVYQAGVKASEEKAKEKTKALLESDSALANLSDSRVSEIARRMRSRF